VNLLAGEYLFLFLGANRDEDDDGPYTESLGRQMDRRTSRGPFLHVASFLEKNLAKGRVSTLASGFFNRTIRSSACRAPPRAHNVGIALYRCISPLKPLVPLVRVPVSRRGGLRTPAMSA